MDKNIALVVNIGTDRLIISGGLYQGNSSLEDFSLMLKQANSSNTPIICWDDIVGCCGFLSYPSQLLTVSIFEELITDFIDWAKFATNDRVMAARRG